MSQTNYDLLPSESIILKSESVLRDRTSGELLLTSMSIYFVTSKGLFSTKRDYQRIPISQISTVGGKAQIVVQKDGEMILNLKNGRETFKFYNDDFILSGQKAQKEAVKWAEAIEQVVFGEQNSSGNSSRMIIPEIEIVADAIGETVGVFKNALGIKSKQSQQNFSERIAGRCSFCGAPVSGKRGQIVRCSYCDADQHL